MWPTLVRTWPLPDMLITLLIQPYTLQVNLQLLQFYRPHCLSLPNRILRSVRLPHLMNRSRMVNNNSLLPPPLPSPTTAKRKRRKKKETSCKICFGVLARQRRFILASCRARRHGINLISREINAINSFRQNGTVIIAFDSRTGFVLNFYLRKCEKERQGWCIFFFFFYNFGGHSMCLCVFFFRDSNSLIGAEFYWEQKILLLLLRKWTSCL